MKFNKIVALALALVMVFALCACGGGNTNKKDDSGSTAKVDTSTVSVGAVVIARDDVPTDQIYAFVSTIFNNLDAIAAQHGKGAELNLEAAASVKGVPYHPGAAKYFEEKGLKVDAVKDGAGTGTAAALSFGTGGDTGTYYGFGSVLANYVSTNSDCKVTALTSGGPHQRQRPDRLRAERCYELRLQRPAPVREPGHRLLRRCPALSGAGADRHHQP